MRYWKTLTRCLLRVERRFCRKPKGRPGWYFAWRISSLAVVQRSLLRCAWWVTLKRGRPGNGEIHQSGCEYRVHDLEKWQYRKRYCREMLLMLVTMARSSLAGCAATTLMLDFVKQNRKEFKVAPSMKPPCVEGDGALSEFIFWYTKCGNIRHCEATQ